MAYQSLRLEYLQIPPQLELITPFQLYFNPELIFRHFQIWRLITNFLFFGPVGFNFLFNMIFLYPLWACVAQGRASWRRCPQMPTSPGGAEGWPGPWGQGGDFGGFSLTRTPDTATAECLKKALFRGRTADFVFMFLFGGLLMTVSLAAGRSPTVRALGIPWGGPRPAAAFLDGRQLFGLFVSLVFLGQAFTIMLVYVWSRRNPYVRMNFFGLLNFQAPFLPWVLMGFSLLLGNSIIVDLLGIAVGHIYFFLEDVFPNQPGGARILKTPAFLKAIFDTPDDDPNYNPLPEERPGGFAWGEGQRLGG